MAPLIFLWFLLANTLLGHVAIATNTITNIPSTSVQSISAPSSNAPTISPLIGRKFGKHQNKQYDTPSLSSPSKAPKSEEMHSTSEGSNIPSHQKTSILDSQGHVHLGNQHHHHHSFDKSVAGGGVILGGLATTFLVSVYCYIRATARHKVENSA